jgi:hypothetical protein
MTASQAEVAGCGDVSGSPATCAIVHYSASNYCATAHARGRMVPQSKTPKSLFFRNLGGLQTCKRTVWPYNISKGSGGGGPVALPLDFRSGRSECESRDVAVKAEADVRAVYRTCQTGVVFRPL